MNKERIEKIIYDLKRSVHDGLEYASDIHIIITSLETLEEVRELVKKVKVDTSGEVLAGNIGQREADVVVDVMEDIEAILNKGEK
ncbi:MAG: hypothetical protein KDH96_00005 [Candidatus Riesia sp.]|nr:hypothetical protein [Candidatus Riesia sp.]